MKTVEQIVIEVFYADEPEQIESKLREWASEIIEECAGNAEATMEEEDREAGYSQYRDVLGNQVYPVVMRGSILKVKELIK